MGCPICEGESDVKYRPFCSRRCADLDLGNWLSDRYSLPADEGDSDDHPPEQASSDDTRIH